MKLYLWRSTLCDYTCGAAFAVAESVEEAARVIEAAWLKDEGRPLPDDALAAGAVEVHELDEPFGFARYGGG